MADKNFNLTWYSSSSPYKKSALAREMKYQNHFPNDNPTEPPFNDPKFCGKVKVPQNSSVLPAVVRRLGWYPKEAGG